jgi:hypothetical protein
VLNKHCNFANLEGLWWRESDKPFMEFPREKWQWKLHIRMPEFFTQEIFERGKEEVVRKKGIELVNEVKFEKIKGVKCIQVLHIGSYSEEIQS